ncbi:MAG: tetratricopeptide repeat protein, partial [Cyanobacteria bacterium]|nr:tetratricopeptide repeat protein [Cyanobacteriota bacterium]
AFEDKHLTAMQHTLEGVKTQQHHASEAINGLSSYLHRLAPVNRVDAVESELKCLKTEFQQLQSALQAVQNEPKPNLNAFQDQINHINRRLNNLPPPFDPTALKQDIDAIIKLAGDLVPKREMSRLIYEIETVQQQIAAFEQMIVPMRIGATVFKKQLDTLISRIDNGSSWTDDTIRAELESLQSKLAEISQSVETLQHQDHPVQAESVSLTELAEFTGVDLTSLDDIDLDQQLAEIMHLFEGESAEANHIDSLDLSQNLEDTPVAGQLAQLLARVEHVEQQLAQTASKSALSSATVSSRPSYDFILALQESQTQASSSSQRLSLLEEVIDQAEHSLTIVLPSPTYCNFSDSTLQAMRNFLNRHGQIEIGLGYLGVMEQSGNLCLDTYWQRKSHHHQLLYRALKRLGQLKRDYPQQFTFKVLGTDENFLICDRTFAVLGVQDLSIASNLYPGLSVGLRTYDPRVIENLTHRFNTPIIDEQDADACFNRALTCYELGDKENAVIYYTQALRLNPHNDSAYNNRGLVYVELGNPQEAMADFCQALVINPDNVSARFNLGYVKAELGDRKGAIADYTHVIEHDPRFIAAYFHRGLARTRDGDKLGAIADYSHVIQLDETAAIAYFYRGLAHTKLNNNWSALQDFRQAVFLFTQQGNRTYLDKATTMVQKLEQLAPIADPSPDLSLTPTQQATTAPIQNLDLPSSTHEQATCHYADAASNEVMEVFENSASKLVGDSVATELLLLTKRDSTLTLETLFPASESLFADFVQPDSKPQDQSSDELLVTSAQSAQVSNNHNGVEASIPSIEPLTESQVHRGHGHLSQSLAENKQSESDALLTFEQLFPADDGLTSPQAYPSFQDLFPDQGSPTSDRHQTPTDAVLSFHDLFPEQPIEQNASEPSYSAAESTLTLEHLF